jgi:DNA helicase IV
LANSHEPNTSAPSPEVRAVVEEEQALLDRVRRALGRAHEREARKAARGPERARDALRELQEHAARASEADLPSLLHDMAVSHRLAGRPQQRLPDSSAPYIAHLRVEEGRAPIDYLLGYVSFFDTTEDVHVVDWRVAPVARIFYRYREGDRFEEEFPGRVAEGLVLARRIVVLENGELRRILGDALLLERGTDGVWRSSDRSSLALQAGGAETAARPGILGVGVGAAHRARGADVTALLDPDQYAAITAAPDRPLLVLGSAGSGKTTVALHRLARIAGSSPAQYPLQEASVVVPEAGLARLCRRLLEPLGGAAGRVRTAEAWSIELAKRVFQKALKIHAEAPPLVTSLKRHPALYRALHERLAGGKRSTRIAPLRRQLTEAFTDRAFLARVVADSAGDLPTTAIEETIAHATLQRAEPVDRQLASIVDPERRRAIDDRAIDEGTPDELAGTIDVEDLPILVSLRARAGALEARPISLLVFDEAEDFSLFELDVAGTLLRDTASVTLAGDEAQQTASSFAGWPTALATLGVSGAATVRLPTSYRCPRPVAELARRLLGTMAPEGPVQAAREGAPIGMFRMPSEAQAHLFLVGALRDLVDREPRASVAVVAGTPDAARRIHTLLADVPEARLVLAGDFTFEPGIDVTDVDQVKGLEFDYVVVPDATAAMYPSTPESRRRLHVAVTRASHQLWIVAGGAASPLLAGE